MPETNRLFWAATVLNLASIPIPGEMGWRMLVLGIALTLIATVMQIAEMVAVVELEDEDEDYG